MWFLTAFENGTLFETTSACDCRASHCFRDLPLLWACSCSGCLWRSSDTGRSYVIQVQHAGALLSVRCEWRDCRLFVRFIGYAANRLRSSILRDCIFDWFAAFQFLGSRRKLADSGTWSGNDVCLRNLGLFDMLLLTERRILNALPRLEAIL